MTRLVIIAGTKGGIGKTFAASLLIDVAIDLKLKPIAYDCDNENRSLSSVFQHVDPDSLKVIQLDPEDDSAAYPLDRVVNDLISSGNGNSLYVVDMKAGTSKSTLSWLDGVPFAELNKRGVEVSIVGCVTSEADSCITFLRWLDYCKELFIDNSARLVIIRNMMAGGNFWYYDEVLKPLVEEQFSQACLIQLPAMTPEYVMLAKKAKTTFGQLLRGARYLKSLQFMQQIRIRRQYQLASEGFVSFLSTVQKNGKEVADADGGRKQHNA